MLDLAYDEDSKAQVDINIIGTGDGQLVEVQGAAEGRPFSPAQLDAMMQLAVGGMAELQEVQKETLGSLWDEVQAGISRLHENSPFSALRTFGRED